MNRFLTKPFFIFALLAASLLSPAAYAQTQGAVLPTVQTPTRSNPDQQPIVFEPFIRTELFFGRNITGGGEVSRKDFDKFLSEFITPRFPDGLTVVNARGQFLNSNGEIERERSIVLILLYPVTARREKNARIEEIREEYKHRFRQQSVLRVDDPAPVGVSF